MQEITLTQNTFKLFPTVYAVQNDTGRELKMIIQDQTLLLGDTGAVAVQRSDGSYYTIAATLNVLDNAFTADISQALTQPGRTLCQLKVTRSGLVVSSYTFAIMVQPSTDGISEAQLGYSVQQLRQDAEDIRTGGMPADLRLALLQIAQKVAYIDDQGQQYYQDLYDALQPQVTLMSISAVYTQSGTVYDTDALDDLKADLVVTATYSDGTTATVLSSAYTLSGSLTAGTSTVTVTYEDKTTTFNVTVTEDADFPLHEGTFDLYNDSTKVGTATVTKGTSAFHVSLSFIRSLSTSLFINFTSGEGGTDSTTIVDNKPTWFTVPSGSTGILSMTNITNASSVTYAMNFRLASASTSSSWSTGDAVHTSDATVSYTAPSAINEGCLFLYINKTGSPITSGTSIAFDVGFKVNGTRYF